MNPFLNKTFVTIWSLFLMAVCGTLSWKFTNIIGYPILLDPTDIVYWQNFMNKMVLNYDTTTGISLMEFEEVYIDDEELVGNKDEVILEKYKTPNILRLDWFGDGLLIFDIPNNIPFYKRWYMWIMLGTKFTKL